MKSSVRKRYGESVIAFGLGLLLGLTFTLLIQQFTDLSSALILENWSKLLIFAGSCSLYHFMEYFYKLCYHFYDLSWNDYQINHSWAYGVAMVLCLTEFGAKWYILAHYS